MIYREPPFCVQQSAMPIQTVKGRVVFFRKEREKISTLKPLTVWIFAVPLRRRKRGTGFTIPPRFRLLILRQNRLRYRGGNCNFLCGASLAPRPHPKNRWGNIHKPKSQRRTKSALIHPCGCVRPAGGVLCLSAQNHGTQFP